MLQLVVKVEQLAFLINHITFNKIVYINLITGVNVKKYSIDEYAVCGSPLYNDIIQFFVISKHNLVFKKRFSVYKTTNYYYIYPMVSKTQIHDKVI